MSVCKCVCTTDPFERYPTYRFGLMDDEPKPFTNYIETSRRTLILRVISVKLTRNISEH